MPVMHGRKRDLAHMMDGTMLPVDHAPMKPARRMGGSRKSSETGTSQGMVQTSPLGEMRAFVRLTNAVFTRDRSVARDLNRYTEEDVKRYLSQLGLQVGVPPLMHWGCPNGKYQALAGTTPGPTQA